MRAGADPKVLSDGVGAQVGNVAREHAKVEAVKGQEHADLKDVGAVVEHAGDADDLEQHDHIAQVAQ